MMQIEIKNTNRTAVLNLGEEAIIGFCIGAMCTLIIIMTATVIHSKIRNADDRVITVTQKQEFRKLMREELNDYFNITEVTEK